MMHQETDGRIETLLQLRNVIPAVKGRTRRDSANFVARPSKSHAHAIP
jgi:hypothetical protein